MTATPKETKTLSKIEYFGEPIYTYSLKQGIDDGFLAPYKVLRVGMNVDLEGYRPEYGSTREKIYIAGVDVSILNERHQYLDPNGKLITCSLKEYTKTGILTSYRSLDKFLQLRHWINLELQQNLSVFLAVNHNILLLLRNLNRKYTAQHNKRMMQCSSLTKDFCVYLLKSLVSKDYHVPKFSNFVHVLFICTKIAKIGTYFLSYVPKGCIIGT